MHRNFSYRTYAFLTAALCLILAISGCSTFSPREKRNSASVVEFLFPDKNDPVAVTPGVPVLSLPIRVGIAFVPSDRQGSRNNPNVLTETRKFDLMQQVAANFKKYPFVKDIEIIPSAYLRPKGSFANLDQLRTIYGVDVVALVSYDQVQFTDQGFLSLTYWTIVGAYIVPGEKNDTHTMLDTVVYDIASRKMLFRAPGTNHVKGRATLVNLPEKLRSDSETSLNEAAKEMTSNLDQQLALFREKVKERPSEYKVVRTPGYSGGGSIDEMMLTLLALFGIGLLRQYRRA
jgi:rhombotail lipoprotein